MILKSLKVMVVTILGRLHTVYRVTKSLSCTVSVILPLVYELKNSSNNESPKTVLQSQYDSRSHSNKITVEQK